MDDIALARTLETRKATYYSRSRGEHWVKGETSGHTQYVHSVRLDCDGDTVLLEVDQVGGACHTGDHTCFDADLLLGPGGLVSNAGTSVNLSVCPSPSPSGRAAQNCSATSRSRRIPLVWSSSLMGRAVPASAPAIASLLRC